MLNWSDDRRLQGSASSDPAVRILMAYVSGNAVSPNRLASLVTEVRDAVATLRSTHSLGSRLDRASRHGSSRSAR